MKKRIQLNPVTDQAPIAMPNFGSSSEHWGTYAVNERYLVKNGEPWLPIMGEFHYSRYPEELWEESILKIKAGGVTILSTYVFWIHHEEIRGQFDWSGSRNLRRFIQLCGKHKLPLFLRIGPWSHGECRNGGFPDWLQSMDILHRTNDPAYMALVESFFGEIYKQAEGLFFKDEGPIVGVQLENEYGHCGGLNGQPGRDHMMKLKETAQRIGFLVPFYTATGWGNGVVVEGETLPVLGGYADAPWARHTEPLKPQAEYVISAIQRDSDIGTDLKKEVSSQYSYDVAHQPYLTAELGGGIQVTGHRRPVVSADDIEALTFTKLASGANLLGFYMYHGGTNPAGHLTTLQESKATGYPNDVPELSYDFQAPIREFGQVSDKYRHLKRLAMFAEDYGADMAATHCYIPEDTALEPEDSETLRYSVRYDNTGSGYVFVSNYQRFGTMTDKSGVEFAVAAPDGLREFAPVYLKAQSFLFMPFNMQLGPVRLLTANVQPLCSIINGTDRTYVFMNADGNKAVYHFDPEVIAQVWQNGQLVSRGEVSGKVTVQAPVCRDIISVLTRSGEWITVMTLSRRDAANAWKLKNEGLESLLITDADIITDGAEVTVTGRRSSYDLVVYPKQASLQPSDDAYLEHTGAGAYFNSYKLTFPQVLPSLHVEQSGAGPESVSYELQLQLPGDGQAHDYFLQLDFEGDQADFLIGGVKAADWFYNGETWEIGLRRFLHRLKDEAIKVNVYPLSVEDPVYMDRRPEFPENGILCKLKQASIAAQYQSTLKLEWN
jgi:beta-galactosidase